MTRRTSRYGFNAATLHDQTVGNKRFIAMMSTNPSMPFQVGTYNRAGFVLPGSVAIFQNPAAAIAEVDRRVAAEIADVADEIDNGWSFQG